MNETFDTKPEPITAKPNWHYDTYFLSQLERLNLRKPSHKTQNPKAEQTDHRASENKPSEKETDASDSRQLGAQVSKRDEVIRCINELAASIGASVIITDPNQ